MPGHIGCPRRDEQGVLWQTRREHPHRTFIPCPTVDEENDRVVIASLHRKTHLQRPGIQLQIKQVVYVHSGEMITGGACGYSPPVNSATSCAACLTLTCCARRGAAKEERPGWPALRGAPSRPHLPRPARRHALHPDG